MKQILTIFALYTAFSIASSTRALAAWGCCPTRNGHGQSCGNPPNHCDADVLNSVVFSNVTPGNFQCVSTQANVILDLRGQFNRHSNQHGAGTITFAGQVTANGQTLQIKRSGRAQSWASDDISYSDSDQSTPMAVFIKAQIYDQNQSPHSQSVLGINNRTIAMACRFLAVTDSLNSVYCPSSQGGLQCHLIHDQFCACH